MTCHARGIDLLSEGFATKASSEGFATKASSEGFATKASRTSSDLGISLPTSGSACLPGGFRNKRKPGDPRRANANARQPYVGRQYLIGRGQPPSGCSAVAARRHCLSEQTLSFDKCFKSQCKITVQNYRSPAF